MNPYPAFLSSGDNAWQMTAATLVGLMSIPALAVLYGGLVQKKWAINTIMMVFTTFCLVLITWVLWGFKLGFGTPLVSTFIGDPRTVLGHNALQGQATIPLVNSLVPSWHLPGGSARNCNPSTLRLVLRLEQAILRTASFRLMAARSAL